MELRLLEIEEAPWTALAARAADLAERCHHVSIDGRLTGLGYRFYALPLSELPSFFVKRFQAGDRTSAITLLAGIDPATGEPVLEDCRSAHDAARRIHAGRGGWWVVRITYGARMVSMEELAGDLASREPLAFAAFAAELNALGLPVPGSCPICCAG